MTVLKDVLRQNKRVLIMFAVIEGLNLIIYLLYNIIFEGFIYAAFMGCIVLICMLIISGIREKKAHERRTRAKDLIMDDWSALPDPESLLESDLYEMIETLGTKLDETRTLAENQRQDQLDYYTTWVHQIKIPIAVMKLKLAEDTMENRALRTELFRIEQYVDMVLAYIRLDSSTNDLLIQKYALDDLIRESIRKHASQFIEKRLKLDYHPTKEMITTDKKWFLCILDQFISNAAKYTNHGQVSISVENETLIIADTGIGIAPEDLPRIFEKGYTGVNGRIGEKSSGLGLYLAKRAADMLSIGILVESEIGVGTRFTLNLRQECGNP